MLRIKLTSLLTDILTLLLYFTTSDTLPIVVALQNFHFLVAQIPVRC